MGSSIGEKLPLWQSHKRVRAATILEIGDDDRMLLELADGTTMWVTPATNMFSRYRPVPLDKYVIYDDGYAAISPRAAFEGGYDKVEEGA